MKWTNSYRSFGLETIAASAYFLLNKHMRNEFTPGCERCVDPFHVVEWAMEA